jgi:hypothetical protein
MFSLDCERAVRRYCRRCSETAGCNKGNTYYRTLMVSRIACRFVCAKLQFGKGGEVAATFCNRDVIVVLCTWGMKSYVIQRSVVRFCLCGYRPLVCVRVFVCVCARLR